MPKLFGITDAQRGRLKPVFRKSDGKPRVCESACKSDPLGWVMII